MVLFCVGVLRFTPLFEKEGDEKMMNSEQYKEHIERTFNAFCKKSAFMRFARPRNYGCNTIRSEAENAILLFHIAYRNWARSF